MRQAAQVGLRSEVLEVVNGHDNPEAGEGTKKLIATQNDDHWRCYDVAVDPLEQTPFDESRCPGLRSLAEGGDRGAPWQ